LSFFCWPTSALTFTVGLFHHPATGPREMRTIGGRDGGLHFFDTFRGNDFFIEIESKPPSFRSLGPPAPCTRGSGIRRNIPTAPCRWQAPNWGAHWGGATAFLKVALDGDQEAQSGASRRCVQEAKKLGEGQICRRQCLRHCNGLRPKTGKKRNKTMGEKSVTIAAAEQFANDPIFFRK